VSASYAGSVSAARGPRDAAGPPVLLARREVEWPRRYTDAEITTALTLVAQGKSLREAGAAVGASHPTVMRWVRNAA
jgi:hypothetical protein